MKAIMIDTIEIEAQYTMRGNGGIVTNVPKGPMIDATAVAAIQHPKVRGLVR
jgi:hypothetical protein